ncbi:MAG: HPF/RaiA family ribosome-associated protein [Acidobacteria bacterium]|nr:HPF/RaiA family ribosome-associated protein [Acidobacteriota bacterium]MBI3663296.1 HPF/RaiA family ribosome-associated protein [Acidobacteriota bacterium]
MKLSLSYKNVDLREPIETEVAHHLGKLEKLLKTYAPDLVQVHASVEKHPRKLAYAFSLNLSLPTGTLHASGDGPDVRLSVKNAFVDLSAQLKKHQARVRRDYQWKRKRAVPALVER